MQYLLIIKKPLLLITLIAIFSLKAKIYPKLNIPVNLDFSLTFLINSSIATASPEIEINFAKSRLYFAISLIKTASNFLTKISLYFNQ